jgi:histidinol-phosphate aminotransferase
MTIRDLMRRDLVELEEYPPSPTIAQLERQLGRRVVKLDANENPYGPSPLVGPALAACCVERYPDAESTALRRSLGSYLQVDPAGIVCSVGGDEMLDLILRLLLEPGEEVIDLPPAFVMYELSTLYNRGALVRVPRREDFSVDVAAVERALTPRTKVIFLCSPNNPTGNPTPHEDVIRLLELGPVVVLDEAYAEFAGRTLVGLIERYPNLVILRTMSKWAALAGIRLGYAVMTPAVAREMNKVRSPYNISIAAQVAGEASLLDREYLMTNVRKIVEERERLYRRLVALPFGAIYPSQTNFLYWKPDKGSASAWKAALLSHGVLIRAIHFPCEALRFSVGTPQESEALLLALEAVHAEGTGSLMAG